MSMQDWKPEDMKALASILQDMAKAKKDFLKNNPHSLMGHKLPKNGSFDVPPQIRRQHQKQNAQLIATRNKKPDFICSK